MAIELAEAGILTIRVADAHLLELVFDSGRQDRHLDYRPALPLVLQWSGYPAG